MKNEIKGFPFKIQPLQEPKYVENEEILDGVSIFDLLEMKNKIAMQLKGERILTSYLEQIYEATERFLILKNHGKIK